MTKSILASVGAQGGVNLTKDVLTVQQLLNAVSPANGGPSTPLTENGVPSSKMNTDIQRFQLKHFGWRGADGRVDPGHQTITKLNELTKRAPPKPPPPPVPPKPVVPQVLSTRFSLIQVGEHDRYMDSEEDFFFRIIDLENTNFPQVYWLGPPRGYRHIRTKAKITKDNYRRKCDFKVRKPLAITDLECQAMYMTNPYAHPYKGKRRGVNQLWLRLPSGVVAIHTNRYLPIRDPTGTGDTGKPLYTRQGRFQVIAFGPQYVDDRVMPF